jgi:hypothetical protein
LAHEQVQELESLRPQSNLFLSAKELSAPPVESEFTEADAHGTNPQVSEEFLMLAAHSC